MPLTLPLDTNYSRYDAIWPEQKKNKKREEGVQEESSKYKKEDSRLRQGYAGPRKTGGSRQNVTKDKP